MRTSQNAAPLHIVTVCAARYAAIVVMRHIHLSSLETTPSAFAVFIQTQLPARYGSGNFASKSLPQQVSGNRVKAGLTLDLTREANVQGDDPRPGQEDSFDCEIARGGGVRPSRRQKGDKRLDGCQPAAHSSVLTTRRNSVPKRSPICSHAEDIRFSTMRSTSILGQRLLHKMTRILGSRDSSYSRFFAKKCKTSFTHVAGLKSRASKYRLSPRA